MFKVTSIYRLDRNIFAMMIFLPSDVTDRSLDIEEFSAAIEDATTSSTGVTPLTFNGVIQPD